MIVLDDPVSDEIFEWMKVKEILGVRVEGGALEDAGLSGGSAPEVVGVMPLAAALAASASGKGVRIEYLVHLRTDQELEAAAPYPPGGVYEAIDGEKVSSIAKRFGVSLAKLLHLNQHITGLSAGSRLLDRTCLVLPPRPHLRWMTNITSHPNFDAHLFAFLQRAVAPSNAIVHPRMPNAPDICLLYTSPSPRDKRQSRMPSSA